MSIINDALKKVQQNLDRQKKVPAGISTPLTKPAPKERFSDIAEAFIIASFLGSLLVLGTFFFLGPKKKALPPPVVDENTSTAEKAPENLIPPPAAPTPPSIPSGNAGEAKNRVFGMTLNGIVKMGEEYVALINNKIVREGDVVGARKVLRIEKDQVKVFDRGETVILKLKRF